MIKEEEGKGQKKAFWWQEWKGNPKSIRSVMFLIQHTFLAFHLGKIGYIWAKPFSIGQKSNVLVP